MNLPFTLERLNRETVLISLPLPVTPDYPHHFRALQHALRERFAHCRDTVAGYRNLMCVFDGQSPADADITALLQSLPAHDAQRSAPVIDIPVCYHPDLAPDLPALCRAKNMDIQTFIALHSRPAYSVYAIGFIPGFPFLGETDARIAAPRHAVPRREVAAGSVGIAGRQTGIYPKNSPGGWQIIGRTPLTLYDPQNGLYSRFGIGMAVRFTPITQEAFHDWRL